MDLVLVTAQENTSGWGFILVALLGLVAVGLVILFIAALVRVVRGPSIRHR